MERVINEQKLKMLIKFEKIKLLEDFYNVSIVIYQYDFFYILEI